jgi:DNA-binding IscR family transcriptional regulator
VPGVFGGYQLARPAADITVLDIVQSVSGRQDMFRCAEIRQRGPMALTAAQCRRPCRIAAVMHEADTAWRGALAAITIADLIADTPKPSADRIADWLRR